MKESPHRPVAMPAPQAIPESENDDALFGLRTPSPNRWSVATRSLPPEAGDPSTAQAGLSITVDQSDAALQDTVDAGVDIVEMNVAHLLTLAQHHGVGADLDVARAEKAPATLARIAVAALRESATASALVTLNSGAAIFVSEGWAWFAAPAAPGPVEGSVVLSRFLAAADQGYGPSECLQRAVGSDDVTLLS